MRSLQYISGTNSSVTFDDSFLGITSLEGLDIAPVNIQEQKSPFQDGTIPIDQLFSPREIVMGGTIGVGGDVGAIYTQRRNMLAVINPKLGPGMLIYTNDFGQWAILNVIPEGPVFKNRNANDGPQQFQVTFYCHDPYLYDVSYTTTNLQTAVSNLVFPITFTAGGIAFSYFTGAPKTVYNLGDYSTPVILSMYGPATNPKLLNVTTGEYVKVLTTLNAGDVIQVNTTNGIDTVLFTPSGGSQSNVINLLDLGSTFFQLGIGPVQLQYLDDTLSSSKNCIVAWRNRYIGA